MIKRIKYSLYKSGYSMLPTIPGSYDPTTKTIEIDMPDEKPVRFGPEWISAGNSKRLRGTSIVIRYWGQGPAQTYRVEAIPDPRSGPGFGYNRLVPGMGNAAKADAIRIAKELSGDPRYTY